MCHEQVKFRPPPLQQRLHVLLREVEVPRAELDRGGLRGLLQDPLCDPLVLANVERTHLEGREHPSVGTGVSTEIFFTKHFIYQTLLQFFHQYLQKIE